MIKLKKIRFKAIGRFVDWQEISLDSYGNLIQVDGVNNNTGGSSGAAKSTVFNALDFLLGLNSIPNSKLQSRLTEEPISVEGYFDLDGQEMLISRSKKLKIVIGDETTTGSSKISEEKLDQILGMPRSLFRLMLHKKQREPGFFLNFTPSEMNSFLVDCLGLGHFKTKLLLVENKIVDLSKMISTTTSTLEASKVGLQASRDAIVALGPAPEREVSQDSIVELKLKMDEAYSNLSKFLEAQKAEEDSLMSKKPAFSSFDTSLHDEYMNSFVDIQKKISEVQRIDAEKASSIQEEIYKLKSSMTIHEIEVRNGKKAAEEAASKGREILKIRKNTCPTCDQSWVSEQSSSREKVLLSEIESLKAIIAAGNLASEKIKACQERLNHPDLSVKIGVNSEFFDLQKEETKLKDKIREEKEKKLNHAKEQEKVEAEYNATLKNVRSRYHAEAEQLRGQADILRRSFDVAVAKMKGFEKTRERYETSLNNLKSQEDSYINKIATLEEELLKTNADLQIAEELKRAIKSYLSCSFDEALEFIGESASNMIRNIPNMATATIQLVGTKETKDGRVKEEVTAMIHMDGEENIPIETLSGGERASADIAIDLSALCLIEDKTNKGIDLFILDEPFTGLDSANIEMVLEVLKNASTHKRLIVVDHNPVVKEQISDRICIIRDGLTSRVTQN